MIWLDDENVVALVTTDGTCVPYRFGLDGSVERLVERDDASCSLARGRRRPDRDRRQRRGRGERGLRGRGRRPTAALEQRKPLVRAVPPRPRAALGPAPGRPRPRQRGSSVRGGGAAGGSSSRSTAARTSRTAPTPWLEMTALADAGFTVVYGNPRGSVGYGRAFAAAIDGNWGDADDSDLMRIVDWAVRQGLGERGRGRPARALVRRVHDDLAPGPAPGALRGGGQREPGASTCSRSPASPTSASSSRSSQPA